MKKRSFKCLTQTLTILALPTFMVATVVTAASSAFAQTTPYYTPPAYGAYIDPSLLTPTSTIAPNPSIIFENQANMNVYGSGGSMLGQLPTGSMFQTQMNRNPFEFVINQPSFNYPAFLETAVQVPTPMGSMIPASIDQSLMMGNGTTLLPDTQFYIPPADFSYQKVRAIGASAQYEDEDINKLLSKVLFADDHGYENDDYDRTDSYRSKTYDTSSLKKYSPSQPAFYSSALRQSEVGEEGGGETSSVDTTPASAAPRVIESNGPFKVFGPTCDCSSRGRACAFNTEGHGRNMFGAQRPGHKHAGVDITGSQGTPIIAAADGYVARATAPRFSGGYGNRIDIKHADGFMTRYAHMSRFIVNPGQFVKKGQLIGYMGSTGHSSGTHLHFEVCKLRSNEDRCHASNVVNPLSYMGSNGSLNQRTQLNMTCSDAAARGSQTSAATSSSPATSRRSSRTSR